MINKILSQKCFEKKPPLLIDVGASGDIHEIWKGFAKYCVCIAFDPDERDVSVSKKTGGDFKEFYMINRIVSDSTGVKNFYLTKSPHCSSSLKSDMKNLNQYDISSYFEIDKEIKLSAITLDLAIKETGYDYVDWFKTDSQGTDLRIFSILDSNLRNRILVNEFEPGILDAYIGEDKLYKIMEYFDNSDFWSDECIIKGMRRIDQRIIEEEFNWVMKRFINLFQKPCAFWAEISYMNQMKNTDFQERDFLLMCVFALVKNQYGFVLEICSRAEQKFDNQLFGEINKYALSKMKIRGYVKLPLYILNKLLTKVLNK